MNGYIFEQCLNAIRHCRELTLVRAYEPLTGQDSLGALASPSGDWHPDTEYFNGLASQLGATRADELLCHCMGLL